MLSAGISNCVISVGGGTPLRRENRSILNTTFYGSIDGLAEIGGIKGIVPRIAGPAWITGFNQLVLDPEDPLNEGFLI